MDAAKGPRPGADPPHAGRPTLGWRTRVERWLIGEPKSPEDKSVFHRLALIPFLAWVGMGADGLSSSAYGPEEGFLALARHRYLAVPLALLVAATVGVISFAYSRVIEKFPSGGGGYVVSTKLLGPRAGLVAACALLVDYILTVSVSIAAGADALFSILPHAISFKLAVCIATIVVLVLLNVRGLKESVTVLAPVFMVFVVTHLALIIVGLFGNAGHAAAVLGEARAEAARDHAALGLFGMGALLARAFTMGAGTFTGIEAVSNGLQAIREPRVENGRRTMLYMATSLAFTASGLLVCYLLARVEPSAGKTLNAVLAERVFPGGALARGLVAVTLASEGALLFVAAQTGFVDGPRVMANMAVDHWLPRRFAALSERLTMHQGVILIGGAAIASLWFTRGDTHVLVLMYSITVFVSFVLTECGMLRYWWREHRAGRRWKRNASVHAVGLVVCSSILVVTVIEKFSQGGWLTLAFTAALIAVCMLIHRHYAHISTLLRRMDRDIPEIAAAGLGTDETIDPRKPTAVILVGAFSGFGVHTMLSVFRAFPGHFHNLAFVSVAVVDSGSFKGVDEIEALKSQTEGALQRYVDLARRLGFPATYEMGVGTEAVAEAVGLCEEIAHRFPRAVFFGSKLSFRVDRWYQRVLHNETAHAIQRRLQWSGIPMLVMPIRVFEPSRRKPA